MVPDKQMTVLVVDDVSIMRSILIKMLEKIGFYNSIEAKDGLEALAILQNQDIGLVISDWNMPNMTGLELLEKVRANEQMKETPFVMMTIEAGEQYRLDAEKAGASAYILKPFAVEQLGEKIMAAFAGIEEKTPHEPTQEPTT